MRGASEDRARVSAAIGVARVICILGVVYVHAWTGRGGSEMASAAPQAVMRWLLMELLGRSAVPLLGMVSGWLAVSSVGKRSYLSFIAGRARTILAPMILWNGLAILLVSGAACIGLISAPIPSDWRWVGNEVLSLASPNEINVQMPFLRDLFVCMAAAPLFVRLPRAALLAVAGAVIAWTLSGVAFPLLLRPQILLFFVVGILARREGLETRAAAAPLSLLAIPYALLALAAAWAGASAEAHGVAPAWLTAGLDLSLRFAAGVFFWALAWRLAAGSAGAVLLKAEPYVFLMFCTHLIMIWLAGPLIGRATGPLGSPLYPLYLLAQPALVLMAAIGVGRLLVSASPAAARILSGGRLASAR